MSLQNANPEIYDVEDTYYSLDNNLEYDDELTREEITSLEVYEHIRSINDPEHPLTLEQLHVIRPSNIIVVDKENKVKVRFTPTVPHCSMATLIGLCIRVKLLRSIPSRFKVTIEISPGSHQSELAGYVVNKQLNDKERVAVALENSHLLDVVNKCIALSPNHKGD